LYQVVLIAKLYCTHIKTKRDLKVHWYTKNNAIFGLCWYVNFFTCGAKF